MCRNDARLRHTSLRKAVCSSHKAAALNTFLEVSGNGRS
nr:MAG TPA: hypothetical protein [Caudoviricetes sp.]